MRRAPHKPAGFTLIELLVVIVILMIILGAVFVMLDPLRRYSQTRNTIRRTDSEAIAKSVSLMLTDTDEHLSPNLLVLDRKWRMIGKSASGCNVLCGDLGQSDHSVYLDGNGSGAFIGDASMGNITKNNPVGFSFWLKPDGEPGLIFQKIGNKRGYSVLYVEMKPGDMRIVFAGYDENGLVGFVNKTPIPANKYTHVLLEFQNDPQEAHIYINGKEDTDTQANWGAGQDDIVTPVPVRIGGRFQGKVFNTDVQIAAFAGFIDDFRIYNGFLHSSDVARIYRGGEHQRATSPNATLVAHWTFDDPPSRGFFEDVSDGESVLDQQELIVSDDVPKNPPVRYELPDHCVDVSDTLVASGQLPKVPVNPATDEVEPSEAVTYYAVRSVNGLISVRSCLAEGEAEQATGLPPTIEVTR